MSALSRSSKGTVFRWMFFFLPFSSQTLITCRWTTSYYRTCVMRRQWLLWRTPLIWFIWRWPNQDQYISMTCTPLQTTPAVRIYLLVFYHSFIMVHEQPGLLRVHISFTWMFYSGNRFFFSARYVWWASSVELKLLCPHTHIVRVVKACSTHTYTRDHTHIRAHTQTILSTATTSTVFCLPLSVDGFSHPTCSWEPTFLSSDFHRTEVIWINEPGLSNTAMPTSPTSMKGCPLSYLYSWYLFFLFMH